VREAFPGANVHRLHRAGDPYIEGMQPHKWGAELWRANDADRDYDLAITDEALEQLAPDRLAHFLRYNAIRQALIDCPETERVWMLSSGILTRAKLGESPADD
jgi:hypothetical protein